MPQVDSRLLALARVEDVASRGPPPPISCTHPCIYVGPPVFGPQTEDRAQIEATVRRIMREFVLDEVRAGLAA